MSCLESGTENMKWVGVSRKGRVCQDRVKKTVKDRLSSCAFFGVPLRKHSTAPAVPAEMGQGFLHMEWEPDSLTLLAQQG